MPVAVAIAVAVAVAVAVAQQDVALHADGERISLAFGIGPENVVPHLVVHHVHPLTLGVVLAAFLPVLRVNEMDLAVLVRATGGPSPVEVFVPLNPRSPQA